MSNYYQQKKNYNKYNSSFSDLDCYGNNYFGNDNKTENKTNYSDNPYSNSNLNANQYSQKPYNNNFSNNNNINKINYKSNPYSNRFSSKTAQDDFSLDDSSKYDSTLFQKNSPLSIFFVIYFTGIIIPALWCNNYWYNVVSGSAFSKALTYTFFEAPLLYLFLWKLIFENLSKAFLTKGGDRFIARIMSFIAIPLIATIINSGIIHSRNQSLDTSPTIVRYLAITDKQVHTHRNKSGTSYTHHVYFTSWVSNGNISITVPKSEYYQYEVGDIIKVNTRMGYYGYQYYDYIAPACKVDRELFPANTLFPLTEKEAEILMEEKKEADLEGKKYNKSKYDYY